MFNNFYLTPLGEKVSNDVRTVLQDMQLTLCNQHDQDNQHVRNAYSQFHTQHQLCLS